MGATHALGLVPIVTLVTSCDVPKVTADYVDANDDNLRELLLIVLGAIVALGLSAFLAFILPRNARI